MADLPSRFVNVNNQSVKNPIVIVSISGCPDLITNTNAVLTTLRYGDPRIVYGSGIVYGNTSRNITNVKDYLSLDKSNFQISQKVEIVKGKGSVSTLTIGMIDRNGYFTNLFTPGLVIPDILGCEVNVYIGFTGTNYPDDFTRIYRGYVSDARVTGGMASIQVSDSSFKLRQEIFLTQQALLSSDITTSTTVIPLSSSLGFFNQITNSLGNYDPGVVTYIEIDGEIMSYGPGAISGNNITVTRAQRGTVAADHTTGAQVNASIQITDNALDMALKIMLSGWNGPWITGVSCLSFNQTNDPVSGIIPGCVVLPTNIDASRDYGLVKGDQVIIVGDTNDTKTGNIIGFVDIFGQSNRVIVTDATNWTTQNTTTSTLSFRSQYDAYPVSYGSNTIPPFLKTDPKDVDVARHQFFKINFLGQSYNQLQFYLTSSENGKTFIESEVYLPLGCYSVTRAGKKSVSYTKPPFGGNGQVPTLTKNNVLNPQNIAPFRATNQRTFYNLIQYSYDYDDTQTYLSFLNLLDSNSLNRIGVTSSLPITSRGAKTALGAATLFNQRGTDLLNQFKNSALSLMVDVTYAVAAATEVGDQIFLYDNNDLQISNFQNGQRYLGQQVFIVLERVLDIKAGKGSLTLLTGSTYLPTDRYGAVSPASVIAAGSTATSIIITDSFGALYPYQEWKKWSPHVGLKVIVHSKNFSNSGTAILLPINSTNPYTLSLSSPGVGYTPSAGDIIELEPYPNNSIASDQSLAKQTYAYVDPHATVTVGVSSTQFKVSTSDLALFQVGLPVFIHSTDWTAQSKEVTVLSAVSVSGPAGLITVSGPLGFTPSAGYVVELIGFPDGGQPYREL